MARTAILLFGVVSYAIFFLTFLYLIAFVGNLQQTQLVQLLPWLPDLVPLSIDAGREPAPLALGLVVNVGLIALFGIQHSVMARSGFKAWLHRQLPPAAERSVYVLVSSLLLVLLFWQWRPMPTVVWAAESTIGQVIGWSVFAAGFLLVLLATFLIDHFELFGLKQVWARFNNRQHRPPRFVQPLFYRLVRHPLYLGFVLAFWGGPVMTVGGLVFALAMTVYILVAMPLEERDLEHYLGDDYREYQKRVPRIIPGLGGSRH